MSQQVTFAFAIDEPVRIKARPAVTAFVGGLFMSKDRARQILIEYADETGRPVQEWKREAELEAAPADAPAEPAPSGN